MTVTPPSPLPGEPSSAKPTAGQVAEQMERERRQRRWVLSPTQRAFVDCTDAFTFYVGGIGAGKTFAGCVRAIKTVLSPEYRGSLGVIAAPTYPMLEDATMRTFFALLPEAAIKSYNKNTRTLVTINDSTILFRSLDKPDTLRGTTLAWFWMDEAPIGGYVAWDILKGRLRQMPYRIQAWATGTPRGRDKFYDAFENPQKRLEGHRLFRQPTWENKHLPADYIKNLNYTGAFYKQEVEGRFEAFAGLVYDEFVPELRPHGHLARPSNSQGFKQMIGGIDWGFNHPCGVVVIGIDHEDRVWVLDEYVEPKKELTRDILPKIVAFTKRYGVSVWWCDSAAPQLIAETNRALDSARVDALAKGTTKGRDSVIAGIQTVAQCLAFRANGDGPGLLVHPDRCKHTIEEFGQYSYKVDERGDPLPGKPEPEKVHDDAMDALRYALHETFGRNRSGRIPTAVSAALRTGAGAGTPDETLLRLLRGEGDEHARRLVEAALAKLEIDPLDLAASYDEAVDAAEARLRERMRIGARFVGILSGATPHFWHDPLREKGEG